MQIILDNEVKRWSEMSASLLIAELVEIHNYELEAEGKRYQFEVEMLENTDEYVHVSVSVDDGRFPFSISPLSHFFTKNKAVETSMTSAGLDATPDRVSQSTCVSLLTQPTRERDPQVVCFQ